ncbi:hypothetical protein [Acinetobacter johnsonii]|uniref:hypothetical protein n=1 Tax=Acinetobacter johnsonii TaxID=40214 RepID=UPI00244B4ADF|nr:hypothetical protein [Acinetobacter johnsonii]MDH0711286.1 hypothetical protein [Acinetobacter johnsonii]
MITIRNTGVSTSKITVLAGQVMKMGVPAQSTIKVIPSRVGRVVKTIATDEQGFYKAYVPLDQSYLIYAQDKSKQLNAVIQDNVVPK